MVLAFASHDCAQHCQTQRSLQFSSRLGPIHRTRRSSVRHLRVAQSFDTPSAKGTAAEPAAEHVEAALAEPVVEEDQHLQTPVPEDVLSEFEHKVSWVQVAYCLIVPFILTQLQLNICPRSPS